MSDENKKATLELSAADPKAPFYITAWLNLDGSHHISSEGKDTLAYEAALESAKEQIEAYGDDALYIIECRAIRKVSRGKIRVTPIKTRPKR